VRNKLVDEIADGSGGGQVTAIAVDTARFFPGNNSGMPLYVIAKYVFDESTRFPKSILFVDDPPADAHVPLAALGVLFAVVALSLQLLVVAK